MWIVDVVVGKIRRMGIRAVIYVLYVLYICSLRIYTANAVYGSSTGYSLITRATVRIMQDTKDFCPGTISRSESHTQRCQPMRTDVGAPEYKISSCVIARKPKFAVYVGSLEHIKNNSVEHLLKAQSSG